MKKENPLILSIETATQICSVALSRGSQLVAIKQLNYPNAHSAKLSIIIDEIIMENALEYKNLDAIAVSKGPGSYTGLRIGVSTAKGLSYALGIPLISVETLRILAQAVKKKYTESNSLAMIDARRMEVYSSIYDAKGNEVKELSADIIEDGIYDKYFSDNTKTIIVGDGAEKCRGVFENNLNVIIDPEIELSARYMIQMVFEKYTREDFEDVAYFEPFYLKNFVAAPSKVKGLYNG